MSMTICPWCGTHYMAFQPNCSNCGGPLLWADGQSSPSLPADVLTPPPLAPRPISDSYAWRILTSGGGWIAALVLGILGLVFSVVGAGLTLGVITAFVGIPFLLLGLVFLAAAGGMFVRGYQAALKGVRVLQTGEAARGQIIETRADTSVRVNGRNPWLIRYQYQANGQDYQGKVRTFNPPGAQLQAGKGVYILYLPAEPQWSSIYPHP